MAEKKDELNFIPAINSTALPKKDTDNVNFYPALNSQEIIDGQYLQHESAPNRSLVEFPSVDKKYVAGQDIIAGQAVGIWGFIVQTTTSLVCDQATYGDAGDAGAVKDGNDIVFHDASGASEKQGFFSFANVPATPSGTGLTMIKWEIRITGRQFNGNTNQNLKLKDLATGFDETTLTWNNKPAFNNEITSLSYVGGAFTTGFSEVTLAEYNNIRSNGIGGEYDADNGAQTKFGDEDDGTPPVLSVRFTYEVQDGSVYLSSGLFEKHANAFRGIAQNTVVKGQPLVVRHEGLDGHLTGLTPFSDYLLSDTPGEINTTGGTFDKVIGNARSAISLQVKYVLNTPAP